ncbi:uncharacterized protein LOC34620798 [Cyclospora cayetanensis]|uniref:Uncharacterized protein LOC34620798 n=1 Tax=Cyclospora cayetanensis TaxID=88456 RepID=A0A6P6S2X1_9EIME|nr:uncharacterized protein LOC34620798 [Cyclospora cayetanensis]
MATTAPPLDASQLRLLVVPSPLSPQKPSKRGEILQSKSDWPIFRPIALPHPSSPNVIVDFFVAGKDIYEMNKSCRSVGVCSALLPPQLVLSDGSLLLATPVDPLLLLLPHLMQQAAASFVPLLEAVAPPKVDVEVRRNLQALAGHSAVLRRLHWVSDLRMLSAAKPAHGETTGAADCAADTSKPPESPASVLAESAPASIEEGDARGSAALGGSLFVRFNNDKTLTFLLRKHGKLVTAIARQRSSVPLGASEADQGGGPPVSTSDASLQAFALSLFSAYLPKTLTTALEVRLRKEGLLREEKPCLATSRAKAPQNPPSCGAKVAKPAARAAGAAAAAEKMAGTRQKRVAGAAAPAANKKAPGRKVEVERRPEGSA